VCDPTLRQPTVPFPTIELVIVNDVQREIPGCQGWYVDGRIEAAYEYAYGEQ
jgi:hypothetical protein